MRTWTIAAGLGIGALTLAPTAAPAQDAPAAPANGPAAVLARARPSIVSVDAVLQLKGQFGGRSFDQEGRSNGQGLVVDGSGLILCSSQLLRPGLRGRGMRMRMPESISSSPTSIKVKREGDETEHDAFLVATDSELGLVFLQLSTAPATAWPTLSLESPAKPVVGDRVLAVSRLGKLFDYAPFLQEALVAGEIHTPRNAWVLSGNVNGAVGLPFFDASGAVVGLLTTLSVENEAGGEQQGLFLLPPRPARTAIGRALERAKELLAERAAKTPEKPADGGHEGF